VRLDGDYFAAGTMTEEIVPAILLRVLLPHGIVKIETVIEVGANCVVDVVSMCGGDCAKTILYRRTQR
jgi:hypothetical protein